MAAVSTRLSARRARRATARFGAVEVSDSDMALVALVSRALRPPSDALRRVTDAAVSASVAAVCMSLVTVLAVAVTDVTAVLLWSPVAVVAAVVVPSLAWTQAAIWGQRRALGQLWALQAPFGAQAVLCVAWFEQSRPLAERVAASEAVRLSNANVAAVSSSDSFSNLFFRHVAAADPSGTKAAAAALVAARFSDMALTSDMLATVAAMSTHPSLGTLVESSPQHASWDMIVAATADVTAVGSNVSEVAAALAADAPDSRDVADWLHIAELVITPADPAGRAPFDLNSQVPHRP